MGNQLRVSVFGSTGPTGVLILREALRVGLEVTAVARTPSKIALQAPGLRVVQGDATDIDSVRAAVAGHDAVVSALGAPYGFRPVRVYSTAAANIIAAMREAGVRRFVGITSGGTQWRRTPNSPLFFELVLKRLFWNLYSDMQRMEKLFAATELDWTILRPPRLLDGPRTGRVGRERGAYVVPDASTITRADLAAEVIRHLGPDGALRAAVAVANLKD